MKGEIKVQQEGIRHAKGFGVLKKLFEEKEGALTKARPSK